MNVRQAYDVWANNYDTVENKTRDLESKVLRERLWQRAFEYSGNRLRNGKNTEFLQTKAKHLVGANFSAEMLEKARAKITAGNVEFRQLDLREDWNFAKNLFDLITCSLALERIENINFVFGQAREFCKRATFLQQ